MLVLSRGKDQRIMIGDNIIVTVTEIRGDKVRIGIEAPDDVRIAREELCVIPEGEDETSTRRVPAPIQRVKKLKSKAVVRVWK